jgi:cytochrome d ubiquinol oxidase subunit II
VLTGAAAVVAIAALWARHWHLARVAAAAQVSLILWGWAAAQAPYLVPPAFTVANSAAPPRTLELFLWALGVGALLLFPSIAYLFWLFKSAGRNGSAAQESD